MDQPGNNHYAAQISQQAVNGRNGYYGQAGYENNGYAANGHGAGGYGRNGYTGNGGQAPAAYHDGVAPGGARTTPDPAATAAEAIMNPPLARDAAPREQEGRAVQETDLADGPGPGDLGLDPAAAAGINSPAERMRELLARSTADHAAIERATATVLDEIRQRLAGLERTVADVREHAGAEQDSASRTAEQMSTQGQRLAGMSATLDGLTAGLSTFSAQLSAIDGRLANADTRLAGADVKLASTEGRVSALDTRFERLDERLDDQYDRVTSIDNRLAATDGRLSLLGTQFAEALKPLADDLRARPVRSEIEAVVTKVVEAVHGDISTRLTSLEDTVLTLAEALLRPAAGHTPPSQLQNGPGLSRQRSLPVTPIDEVVARAQPPALEPSAPPSQPLPRAAGPRPRSVARLLPLDRARWLARDVHDDPVDVTDLVSDPGRDPGQYVVRQPCPVGGHRVLAGDRAQHDRVPVSSPISLNAYRAHVGQQHNRALPDGLVQAGRGQFGSRDRIGLPEDLQSLRGHLADDADAQARSGERLPPDDLRWQPELFPYPPHLVLEQRPQRLDELELEVIGQPAHVMVRLDVRRSGASTGLDHVRVERSLHEELGRLAVLSGLSRDLPGRPLERPDELTANDLPLGLRVGDAVQGAQERVGLARHPQPDAGRGDEVLLDLLRLPLAQQPVVNEDAGQPVANGPLDERGGDR